ncbi:hypothetical protein HPB50_000970 [Hyalomma asiaticum]|uniref:Uncharacterized protein n=1 Tax=Hyalomma asiaticum TaxID=266040 RepID=A0ACB7TF13_HYAAI|nr:hypothetical protein HPB50_000970 [Hyalomma asiaticum]
MTLLTEKEKTEGESKAEKISANASPAPPARSFSTPPGPLVRYTRRVQYKEEQSVAHFKSNSARAASGATDDAKPRRTPFGNGNWTLNCHCAPGVAEAVKTAAGPLFPAEEAAPLPLLNAFSVFRALPVSCAWRGECVVSGRLPAAL